MATSVSQVAGVPQPGHMSDMTLWDLSDYATADVQTSNATKFKIEIGGITWTFTGSGFTYDGDDLLATGTITGLEIAEGSDTYARITDFSMNVATTFIGFMNAQNTTGFQQALFAGDDEITDAYHALGHAGNDTITGAIISEGGTGDDVITVNDTGSDIRVYGGNNNDTVIFDNGDIPSLAVFGGNGTDTIMGTFTVLDGWGTASEFERIGDSTINGTSAGNRIDLRGLEMDPNGYTLVTVYGGNGADKLFGVKDGDTDVYGGSGNDAVHTKGGTDHLDGGNGDDQLIGGFGDDVIVDMSGITRIRGAAGNDTITVADGDDKVIGNENDDVITSLGANTGTRLYGGSGNDTLRGEGDVEYYGGQANDIIIFGAGIDTGFGDLGDDTFRALDNTHLGAADNIDGNDGGDSLELLSAVTPFTLVTHLTSVEYLKTQGGQITMDNAALTGSAALNVYGGTTIALDFDGTAETSGRFIFFGTDFNDALRGGQRNDEFHAGEGDDVLRGGDGDDLVRFVNGDSTLTADDIFDGGADSDTLILSGPYGDANALVFGANTIISVETIVLVEGNDSGDPFSYELTLDDGNVAAGKTLTIDATDLRNNGPATIDGSAETDGKLRFLSGDAADTFIGGAGRDTFDGGAAGDIMDGRGNIDQFNYGDVSDSTSKSFDTIIAFDASKDLLGFAFAVGGVDAAVIGGLLSKDSFDPNLESAVGSAQLAANHAVLFTPDRGFFAGLTFLIVDQNGVAGYQRSADFVIELSGATHLEDLADAFVVV